MSPKQVATVLKRLRGEMRQEALAKKAKVSRGYLAAIEAATRRIPPSPS